MTEKPKIGVYICHCGINISATVDVEAVTGFARSPNVKMKLLFKRKRL